MADGSHITTGLRLATPIVEDFAYLARRMRPDEIDQFLAFSGATEWSPDSAARELLAKRGASFVLVDPGNLPVVAGGFEPISRGVVEAWMLGTMDGWAEHWRRITTACRRQMDAQCRRAAGGFRWRRSAAAGGGLMDGQFASGGRRVRICALASRTKTHEWYERGLGMQREGVLRRYCADGSDAVMFSRIA